MLTQISKTAVPPTQRVWDAAAGSINFQQPIPYAQHFTAQALAKLSPEQQEQLHRQLKKEKCKLCLLRLCICHTGCKEVDTCLDLIKGCAVGIYIADHLSYFISPSCHKEMIQKGVAEYEQCAHVSINSILKPAVLVGVSLAVASFEGHQLYRRKRLQVEIIESVLQPIEDKKHR